MTIRIKWPAIKTRVIPNATQDIRIRVYPASAVINPQSATATYVAQQDVQRPTGSNPWTSTAFSSLPAGEYVVRGIAYADIPPQGAADYVGTDAPLGLPEANVPVEVQAGATANVGTITLDSTVAKVQIIGSASLDPGSASTYKVVATDSVGNTVMTLGSDTSWSASNSSISFNGASTASGTTVQVQAQNGNGGGSGNLQASLTVGTAAASSSSPVSFAATPFSVTINTLLYGVIGTSTKNSGPTVGNYGASLSVNGDSLVLIGFEDLQGSVFGTVASSASTNPVLSYSKVDNYDSSSPSGDVQPTLSSALLSGVGYVSFYSQSNGLVVAKLGGNPLAATSFVPYTGYANIKVDCTTGSLYVYNVAAGTPTLDVYPNGDLTQAPKHLSLAGTGFDLTNVVDMKFYPGSTDSQGTLVFLGDNPANKRVAEAYIYSGGTGTVTNYELSAVSNMALASCLAFEPGFVYVGVSYPNTASNPPTPPEVDVINRQTGVLVAKLTNPTLTTITGVGVARTASRTVYATGANNDRNSGLSTVYWK